MKGIEFGSDLKVRLPARFNVAVPFVDRHLAEGRGAKVAIRTASETVTYAELAERVNRAGNALLAAGLKPGDRLLMVIKDCPAFFYLFWGAIKAGIVPAPLNTMLRAADYAYLFEDSGCGLVVYSSEFAQEVEPALKQVAVKAPHGRRLPRRAGQGLRQARGAARRADRRLLLALLLGLDRPAQGRRAPASRHGGDQRALRRARARRARGRRQLLGGQALLRLRARQLHDLPAVDRQHRRCSTTAGRRPTRPSRPSRRFKPTLYFGVPTLYAAQLAALEKKPRDFSSIRACVSAAEALPADIFRRWKERTGTVILDGIGSTECLHIFIGNRLDDYRPGTSGKPVPGYEVKIVDEHGKPVPRGEGGRAVDPLGIGRQVLLEQAGEDGRDHGRRLAQHRRHLPPGRGRLLHLRRPQRRHAEGGRHLVLAGRGRELPDRPSRRARGGRGRPCRRAQPDQAEGLRGAEAGGRRRRLPSPTS